MKTKILFLMLCLLSFIPRAHAELAPVAPSAGSGTEAEPYQLATPANIVWFKNMMETDDEDYCQAYYVLTADISLSEICSETAGNWIPISNFAGHLNGQNHTISGLYSTAIDCVRGFFSGVYHGEFANLTIQGNISSTGSGSGMLAYVLSDCTLTNVTTNGTISCAGNSGGFAYRALNKTSFVNCVNNVAITCTGYNNVGGFVNRALGTTSFVNCVNNGTISGAATCAGGIVGYCDDPCSIERCTNTGAINIDNGYQSGCGIGGIAGYFSYESATISQCINTATINQTNTGYHAGGIAGYLGNGLIQSCYNSGNVTSEGYKVGGIVAAADGSKSQVFDNYNTGNLKGLDRVAGIIGYGGSPSSSAGRNLSTGNIWCTRTRANNGSYSSGLLFGFFTGKLADNNYYLSTATLSELSTETLSSEQWPSYYKSTKNICVTPEQMASGEVAYKLQADRDDRVWWSQNLSTETSPQLNYSGTLSSRVYCNGNVNCAGEGEKSYSNTRTTGLIVGSHNYNSNAICSICHQGQLPEIVGNVYNITKVGHLMALTEYKKEHTYYEVHFKEDLDLSCVCGEGVGNWTPIGNDDYPFYRATVYGEGHTVSNLYINSEESGIYPSLFGYAYYTEVQSLNLDNVYINAPNADHAGALAGQMSCGRTYGVSVLSGSITGKRLVGGITGISGGEVSWCKNYAKVTGNENTGGIVGLHSDGTNAVRLCENHGNVSSSALYSGGIVGDSYGPITQCFNDGVVVGEARCVGGIAGMLESNKSANDCLNTGNVVGNNYNTGGIVGYSGANSTLSNCLNTGNVSNNSSQYYGLIVGGLGGNNTINHCAYLSTAVLTDTYHNTTLESVGFYADNSDFRAVTSAELKSGEIAVYLQNTRSGHTWGQLLNTDLIPYPNEITYSTHPEVYAAGGTFDCRMLPVGKGHVYTNTEGSGDVTYLDHVLSEYGVCTVCHKNKEPELIDNYYHVSLPGELCWVRDKINSQTTYDPINICLDADINLSHFCSETVGSWYPIGNNNSSYTRFKGTFDGQGHTIRGLYINYNNSQQALIGYAEGATIKNLTVEGYVQSNSSHLALILGYGSQTTLTNLESRGEVWMKNSSANYVGGIAGYLVQSRNLTNLRNYATVTGDISNNFYPSYCGGIAGYVSTNSGTNGVLSQLVNYGNVTGANNVGGLIGEAEAPITITYSANHGNLTCLSNNSVGGIVGYNSNSNINHVYSDGNVTALEDGQVHPLFGYYYNSYSYANDHCYFDSNVVLTNENGVLEALDDYSTNDNNGLKRNHALFESGAVAYELGVPFGQTIGRDLRPELNAPQVYYGRYQHANPTPLFAEPQYSNLILTDVFEDHNFVTGFCTICGKSDGYVYEGTGCNFADWTSDNQEKGNSISEKYYSFHAEADSPLSFDWTVGSETNYDKFYAYLYESDSTTVVTKFIDGESGESKSGHVDYTITAAGDYVFKVWYTKDGSVDKNGDTATMTNGSCGSFVKTSRMFGDLNSDAVFDAEDINTLKNMVLKTKEANMDGDYNHDGQLTISDVLMLIRQLLIP